MSIAPLRSERFRREREDDWKRLERLLGRAEKGAAGLSDEDLIALPVLHRAALSSLSVARATSLDANLVGYLEALCARSYFLVYGTRSRPLEQLAAFFRTGWPAAAKSLWPETLVATLALLLGMVAAFWLVSADPQWFYSFIPSDFADERNPTASTETLREGLYDKAKAEDGLSVFAASLFTHNSQVSLLAFALGFAFGVPTVLLVAYNGCILGAFVALYVSRGLGVDLGGWLLIHGSTELFACVLAGAAGLRIGRAVAFPGALSRLDSAAQAGRSSATMLAGVVVMLFCAGLLEGFGRQLIVSTPIRYAIAGGMLALWLAYFYLPRPAHGPER